MVTHDEDIAAKSDQTIHGDDIPVNNYDESNFCFPAPAIPG